MPEHTEIKTELLRTIVRSTFGDIVLLRDDKGNYLVMKDFRGDEEMAIHSYVVHGELVRGGVPTFDFYCLDTGADEYDQQDKVLMPYIGTPEFDADHPQDGDEVCVGPLQSSEAMNALQRTGFRWEASTLDIFIEDARKIIEGSVAHPIDLAHDSVFFKLRFQDGAWTPTGIMIGDFDAVNLIDPEEKIDLEQLRAKNRRVVIGSIYSLLSDVQNAGKLSTDAAISQIEAAIAGSASDPSLDLSKTKSWDDL